MLFLLKQRKNSQERKKFGSVPEIDLHGVIMYHNPTYASALIFSDFSHLCVDRHFYGTKKAWFATMLKISFIIKLHKEYGGCLS